MISTKPTEYEKFRLSSHCTTTIKRGTPLTLLVIIIGFTVIQSANFSAIAQAQAQSQSSVTYLTYTNSTLGISIQHPSNWIMQHRTGQAIAFAFPTGNNQYGAVVQIGMYNQPETLNLNQYLSDKIKLYQSQYTNFHLVQSTTNYTLAGSPAYRMIATFINGTILTEIIETGTFVGPNMHYIQVFVNQNLLSYYAPIINHMKDSFSIAEKPTTYLTYQNSTNGVSIQYPSDWIKNQTQNGQTFVRFNSPDTDSKGYYRLSYDLVMDNQPQSLDLKQYLQDEIKSYQINSSGWKDFHLVQSNSNYSLASRPAYEIIGTAITKDSGLSREVIETGTFVGPKVFYNYISVDPNLLFYYAPVINHMKDSFSVITPRPQQSSNATKGPNNATSTTVTNNLN